MTIKRLSLDYPWQFTQPLPVILDAAAVQTELLAEDMENGVPLISNAQGALQHSWTALYPGFGVRSALHVQRRCSAHEPKERKELIAPGEVNHSQPFIFLDATHDSGGSVRMETSTTDSSLIIFWEMSKLNQFSSFHGNVLPSLQTPDNLVQSAAGDG
ncbi:hypothetical protein GPC19245_44200 (plasmid) [Enterobacter asburiae]